MKKLLASQPIAKYAQRVSLVCVGVCLFLVTFMVSTKLLFTDEVVATGNLRAMARVYYEDYYYPKFANNRSGNTLAAAFEPYSSTGFRPVTLRQLLSFDNNRLKSQSSHFANCNKIATNIKITPLPPYRAEDYHLETTLVCGAE